MSLYYAKFNSTVWEEMERIRLERQKAWYQSLTPQNRQVIDELDEVMADISHGEVIEIKDAHFDNPPAS